MTDPSPAEELFFAALALPPAGRIAYLDANCPDPAVRARVEKLLAAQPKVGDFLADSPAAVTGTLAPGAPADEPTAAYPRASEHAGAIIAGKYTLVEVIGEGGMGSVWRAKQTEPVKRFVAVKLIKAGMDSKTVLARFDAERQALALMDHPHIAKVLDGGLHEHRPFFVMELVKGVPITEYCDHHKLTPKGRLELFVQVCQAIQHAHQKGIIHRDIKPSNVLIALYDDKPVVKVIDFGVAKATGGALTEHTIDTGFGGVVGTPQYMSPEQATFNNLDIDTRSDVYALGVLLYELLAGSPPFARKELEKKGLLEILRVVREEEPPRPSTKLSTADALPTLSANRGTEPKKLTGLLRNELDWIVMKALEKDRTRRYETANGFAADVLRYLGGEAVQAHPPSTAYRLKKFARKNRAALTTAAALALLLVAGVAVSTWQAVRATRAEGVAQQRFEEAETARHNEADRAEGERVAKVDAQDKKAQAERAAEAERVAKLAAQDATALTAERLRQIELINNSVFDIFAELDIRKVKAGNEPVEAVLAKKLIAAGQKLDEKAIHDPLVLAGLRHRLGQTLLSLGEAEAAIGLFEKARETRTAKLGADHPDTLMSMNNLAGGYQAAGKLDRALPLFQEAAAGIEKRRFQHEYAGGIVTNLIGCHERLKQFDQAEAWRRKWLAVVKDRSGADSLPYAGELAALGLNLLQQKKWADAEPVLRECLAVREKTQPDVWATFNTQSMLGGALLGQQKYADAEPLLLKGYEGMKQREKTIPRVGRTRIPESLDRLIELYNATNKPDEAKRWRAERAKYPFVAPMPRQAP